MSELYLPDILHRYREVLEKTAIPVNKITCVKAETEPQESKIGGTPWFPERCDYPRDKHGKPMKLLAQINFEEMPPLENFPQRGILQFFLSADDDVFGMDFDDQTNQENFRVIYHNTIPRDEVLKRDFSELPETDFLPVSGEARMVFSQTKEPVSEADYRFDDLTGELEFSEEESEAYDKTCLGDGHKAGGYPFFTQGDVRDYGYSDHEILLLQLDSDESIDMYWGDNGVANFFIKKEDLLNLDFSRVLYNWDCY